MMKYYLSILLILLMGIVKSQHFELNLLDEEILEGEANPMEPIIFHFEATNTTDSTFLVDMIRVEMDVPEGWEISLCTEACFPPEISETVFFLDEMATDEVSVYFYASSPGQGTTQIQFINRLDTTNNYTQNLTVNAIPVGIEESVASNTNVYHDSNSQNIVIEGINVRSDDVIVYDVLGNVLGQFKSVESSLKIPTHNWSEGLYFVVINSGQARRVVVTR